MNLGRIAGIGLAVILLFCAVASVTTVSPGHVGVIKRFGAVTGEYFEQGLHFKVPFIDTVIHVDTRIGSVDEVVNAGSADKQEVKAVVSAQYSLNAAVVPLMIQELGDRAKLADVILSNALQESTKAVTATFNAGELLTSRPRVKIETVEATEAYIRTALVSRHSGLKGLVKLNNLGVKDLDFSDEFNRAIEATVKAQQEELEEIARKNRRITKAEAANAEKKLQADADAYQVQVISTERAAAIDREGKAIRENPAVIQLRLAEKWNGDLPRLMGTGTVPFINLDQFGGSTTSARPTQ